MNAEINLRVNEDLSSAMPRAVESVRRLQTGLDSVLETTKKSTEAFRQWSEQVRTVQAAQAVDMATRPIGQPARGTILDAQGRPISGPGAGGPMGATTAVLDMKKSMDDLVSVIEDLAKELGREARGTAAPSGGTEGGGGIGGRRRNKIAPNEGEPQPKSEDGLTMEHYRRAKGMGNILASFARGNPVGATLQAGQAGLDSAASGWNSMSGLAKGGMVAGGAVLALAMGANELSKVYEEKMGTGMDLYGQMGLYGAGSNSGGIRRTMAQVSAAASQEGYTFDQGAAATTGLLRAGVSVDNITKERATLLRYARYMGLNPQDLTEISGMAAKTGNGNILGYGLSGVQQQGIGTGRALEYLSGIKEVLEDGFRDGIKVDAKGTATAMNWLAQGSDLWKGEAGARMWNQIRGGISRATGLSQQNDALIFRAANAQADSSGIGKDWNTLLKMENPNVDTVKNLWGQITGVTGGNAFDSRMMLKDTLGLNFHQTDSLAGLLSDPEKNKGKIEAILKDAGSTDSQEKDFMKTTEEFQQVIRETAVPFFEGKSALAKTILEASKAIVERFGGNANGPTQAEIKAGQGSMFTMRTLSSSLPAPEDVQADEASGKAPKGSLSNLMSIYKLLGDKETNDKFRSSGDLAKNTTIKKLMEGGITESELGPLLAELISVLKGNTVATKDNTNSGVKIAVPTAPAAAPATKK